MHILYFFQIWFQNSLSYLNLSLTPRCIMHRRVLHLHFAVERCDSLLHLAVGSQILPLKNAAGVKRKLSGNISPLHNEAALAAAWCSRESNLTAAWCSRESSLKALDNSLCPKGTIMYKIKYGGGTFTILFLWESCIKTLSAYKFFDSLQIQITTGTPRKN